jgi:hypothetical protein
MCRSKNAAPFARTNVTCKSFESVNPFKTFSANYIQAVSSRATSLHLPQALGHSDVATTMVYTHVLNRGGKRGTQPGGFVEGMKGGLLSALLIIGSPAFVVRPRLKESLTST